MEKELFIETFAQKGCPICYLKDKRFEEFLFWFEMEGFRNFSSIKTLQENINICQRHRPILLNLQNRLFNTFEPIIESDLKLFNKLLDRQKTPKKLLKGEISKECRFCIEEKRIEELLVDFFIQNISDESFLSRYLRSDAMICRKHLFAILNKAPYQKTKPLIEKTINYLKQAENQTKNYFKKLDYLCAEKPHAEAYKKILPFYLK
ncbi:hypothetical protein [Hippea jasoniae]|uniref:hypothetical protein n=1 Tax=Hippea jasoniae TaxID=944479 RepID=UPI00055640B1|nr:hypothetical protein [Hippea jasoniae]